MGRRFDCGRFAAAAGYLFSQGKSTQKGTGGKAVAQQPARSRICDASEERRPRRVHYRARSGNASLHGHSKEPGRWPTDVDPLPRGAARKKGRPARRDRSTALSSHVLQADGQLARDQAQLKNSLIDLDRYKVIYAQRAIPEQQLATQGATVLQNKVTSNLTKDCLTAPKSIWTTHGFLAHRWTGWLATGGSRQHCPRRRYQWPAGHHPTAAHNSGV